MGGLTLTLIGMAVMLVAPLHRVTSHRRERPHLSAPLRASYPPVADDGLAGDLLDTIR